MLLYLISRETLLHMPKGLFVGGYCLGNNFCYSAVVFMLSFAKDDVSNMLMKYYGDFVATFLLTPAIP